MSFRRKHFTVSLALNSGLSMNEGFSHTSIQLHTKGDLWCQWQESEVKFDSGDVVSSKCKHLHQINKILTLCSVKRLFSCFKVYTPNLHSCVTSMFVCDRRATSMLSCLFLCTYNVFAYKKIPVHTHLILIGSAKKIKLYGTT